MSLVWKNIKNFCIKLGEHHISEYTAQCAYYTILSFIPFIVLIVTLIQYTGISQSTLNSVIQKLIPETMNETLRKIAKKEDMSFNNVIVSCIQNSLDQMDLEQYQDVDIYDDKELKV